MRDSCEVLYKKAHKKATMLGFSKIADDFACWYVIKILEGKSQHQRIKDALKDYLRHINHWDRILKTQPRFVEYKEQRDSRSFKEKEIPLILELENEVTLTEVQILHIMLHYFHGWTLNRISQFFGFSDSRSSQILKGALAKIRPHCKLV